MFFLTRGIVFQPTHLAHCCCFGFLIFKLFVILMLVDFISPPGIKLCRYHILDKKEF